MNWLGNQISRQLTPHLNRIPEGEWLETEFIIRMVVYRKGQDIEIEAGYVIPHTPTWWDTLKRRWASLRRKGKRN